MAPDVSMISVFFLRTRSFYQSVLLIYCTPFPPWRGEAFRWWHCAVLLTANLLERVVYTPFPSHPFTLEPTCIRLSSLPSIKTAVVKVTIWTLLNAIVNSQSSVYLINTLLIRLSYLKHLFYLASRAPISVLLPHYWQFYCRLFSWFIQTSKTWSAPGIRFLYFPRSFLVLLFRRWR